MLFPYLCGFINIIFLAIFVFEELFCKCGHFSSLFMKFYSEPQLTEAHVGSKLVILYIY